MPPFYSIENKNCLLKLNLPLETKIFMVLNISMISPCSAFLFSYMIQSSPIDSLYKKKFYSKIKCNFKISNKLSEEHSAKKKTEFKYFDRKIMM